MTRNCELAGGFTGGETLREKICDRTLLWAILALVENDGARAEFIDDLAAGSAGRAWNALSVRYC